MQTDEQGKIRVISIKEVLRMKGAKSALAGFFCYCSFESTTGLWASSYMTLYCGIDAETAAGWAAQFYLGITIGRFAAGFISDKLGDKNMTRLGLGIGFFGVAVLLISVVQNDFALISFPHFRILTVIAVSLLLLFFCRMPAGKDACPRYVTKESGLVKPKKLLYGTYVLEFVSALMAVSGPSISDGIKNGVFITYLMDMAASFGIYFLYKKAKIHPFRSISICIGVGCIGFLLMLVVPYLPFMAYVSCAFIGVGMVPCQMIPLYNVMLMKNYPSRYLPPIAIGLAMAAVLVQSSLVEIFRDAPHLLYLTYSVIMVILVIIYLQIEPHFFYAMRRKLEHRAQREAVATEMAQEMKEKSEVVAGQKAVESEITENSGAQSDNVFDVLSKREKEVVDLIASGYSNAEIASALFISPHTVNDHTKKIYRKLDVHSRYELTALVNKMKTDISF